MDGITQEWFNPHHLHKVPLNLRGFFSDCSELCVAVAPSLTSIQAVVTSMHQCSLTQSHTGDHTEDKVVRFNGSGSKALILSMYTRPCRPLGLTGLIQILSLWLGASSRCHTGAVPALPFTHLSCSIK